MGSCLGTVWVCTDCLIVAVNGDEIPDRPDDLPEVLSALREGESLTPGMGHEEHACGRTAESWRDGAECDCETNEFSTASCDACGDWHHGTRHAMTLWRMNDGRHGLFVLGDGNIVG